MEVHHLGDVVVLITKNGKVFTLQKWEGKNHCTITCFSMGFSAKRKVVHEDLKNTPWERWGMGLIPCKYNKDFYQIKFEGEEKSEPSEGLACTVAPMMPTA